MSGKLYQLYSSTEMRPGQYYRVNSQHDIHGRVVSSKKQKSGRWLNQVHSTKIKVRSP